MNKQELYTIDQVIENAFDFSGYSEEEKKQMVAETSSMIMEAALLRSLTDASEETQGAFQKMIKEEPDEQRMASFIADHFPHFEEIVASEIHTFLNSEDAETISEGEKPE